MRFGAAPMRTNGTQVKVYRALLVCRATLHRHRCSRSYLRTQRNGRSYVASPWLLGSICADRLRNRVFPTLPDSALSLPDPVRTHAAKITHLISWIDHATSSYRVVFIGRPQSAQGTLAVPPAFLTGCEQPDMRSMMPYLDIGQFLALPRGESTAGDALSMAVMSVAAGHLAHLHHTAGLQALLAGDEAAVSRTAASEARYRAVGRSMANTSLSLVRSSLDLAQLHLPGGAEVGVSGDRSDDDAVAHVETMTRLLVACSFAVLTDCISGGHEHQKGLTLAKEAVVGAGGARRMLSTLAASLSPTSSYASPFAATRRRRLRLLRSVLEE